MSEVSLRDLVCGDYYFVCVGTELRSDDAAGLRLCELLITHGFPENRIIMCEFGLENCMLVIKEFLVRKALLIDAALISTQEKETPDYFITNLNSINNSVALVTTHSIPIKILIELLRKEELLEDVWVLGIVARNLELGEEISSEVRETINYLAELIIKTLDTCSTR